MWGARGENLGTWGFSYHWDYDRENYAGDFHATASNVYFGGKLISDGNKVCSGANCTRAVFQDRLGTNRASGARFYPYGDEIGGFTATSNDREKYGTYVRDSMSGLDYADQRYYASGYGRFSTADPYAGSAGPSDPGSWNRYSYAGGDPVNNTDPSGLFFYRAPSMSTCRLSPASCSPYGTGLMLPGDLDEGGGGVSTEGQTKGNITVKNFTRTGKQFNAVTKTLNGIQDEILGGDNPCSKWLNSGVSSASDALTLLLQSGSYGVGSVVGTPTIAAFVGTKNADGTPTGIPSGTNFTVNSGGAFFNSGQSVSGAGASYTGGSSQAQAFILIHELAHLLELPNFSPNDAGSSATAIQAERDNNNMVQVNCDQQIQGFN